MEAAEASLLFGAAVVGGGVNAIAGGGGFLAILPPLLLTRVPPLASNAMVAVALWPGFMASLGSGVPPLSLRREGVRFAAMGLMSTVGAAGGALLLVRTPPALFLHLVPALILLATLLFAASGGLVARRHPQDPPEAAPVVPPLRAGGLLSQLLVGGYGGYFGANLGLVLVASLSLAGMRNPRAIRVLTQQLAICNSTVTAAIYLFSGLVLWPQILVLMAGSILGGWGGRRFGHTFASNRLHMLLVVAGLLLSSYMFVSVYF